MNSNGRTPISISNIESSLEAMTRRLESSSSSGSKVRKGGYFGTIISCKLLKFPTEFKLMKKALILD